MALLVSTCDCGARWSTFDRTDVDNPHLRAGWCPLCEDQALAHLPTRWPSYLHGWHLIEEAQWPASTRPPTARSSTTTR